MYQELADMACERIVHAISQSFIGSRPVKALFDPYNPSGSSLHVNFTTRKAARWQTDSRKCHVNWVVLDSDWEAEFCRVAESHPRVIAYVKNQGLGFEVPYRHGSRSHTYLPDFIALIDDGRSPADPLHLIVEIKGIHGEDAKEKRPAVETCWLPGVNRLASYGRWAFLELRNPFGMEKEFGDWVEGRLAQEQGGKAY
jgi:type III restriction enzyme